MIRIIRNKLTITPKTTNSDEAKKQIDEVFRYCRGEDEKGQMKEMLFQKISPIPTNLKSDSKELDDWLLNNWGTREKAYNACWISDNEIIFDTFGEPAIPIAYKIIRQFPDIDFKFEYASNKTGTKTGTVYTSKGHIFFSKEKDYSKRAYYLAFELRPHLGALYTLNMETDTYEYDVSDIKAELATKGFYKEPDGTMLMTPSYAFKKAEDDIPF
jgi:hypothetical protein